MPSPSENIPLTATQVELHPLPPITPELTAQALDTLESVERFNSLARIGISLISTALHFQGWRESRHSVGDCVELQHPDYGFIILVSLSPQGRAENIARFEHWQNQSPCERQYTFDILDMLAGGTALAMRAPTYSSHNEPNDPHWKLLQARLDCQHVGTLITKTGPYYGKML